MEMVLRLELGLFALALLSVLLMRTRKSKPIPSQQSHQPVPRAITKLKFATTEDRTFQHYKELYVKLHNLERHREIIPEARALLVTFLSEALQLELEHPSTTTILSLKTFSATGLDSFVLSELDRITQQWQHYVARRKQGQPRELFPDAAAARRWLVQRAPLKFVDGASLGHVHKITTPFRYRRITKAAWQILSEELGDGDLAKCHAHVYAQLLEKIGVPCPAPDSDAFAHHPGMDDKGVWRSALAQLLISLWPNDFLPEILGFNLHFELLTMETLLAAKELREVGVDPYYFTLHVTIDNADSGHTAMASRVVTEYMRLVETTCTEVGDAARQTWERVQAGFVLSKNIHMHPAPAPGECSGAAGPGPNSDLNNKVMDIFLAKAAVSRGVHEHCPVSIGGRALSAWLDPERLRQREWQVEFLQCLANARPWVYKGESARSRLVQQLRWGGSMFGAFTDREVAVVREWIESLSDVSTDTARFEAYVAFEDRTRMSSSSISATASRGQDPTTLNIDPVDNWNIGEPQPSTAIQSEPLSIREMDVSKLQVHKILPLWFVHSCLLESAVSIPWKVATPVGCAIVRLLRAQSGSLPEPTGVNGMDEMFRADQMDLVDIGLEMTSRLAPEGPVPGDIEHALKLWSFPFTEKMLGASARPIEFKWILLGMTQAFAELHDAVSSSSVLLSEASRAALGLIAKREHESLNICVRGVAQGSAELAQYRRGYLLGLQEIGRCFES